MMVFLIKYAEWKFLQRCFWEVGSGMWFGIFGGSTERLEGINWVGVGFTAAPYISGAAVEKEKVTVSLWESSCI
jgi:hypothetical protein